MNILNLSADSYIKILNLFYVKYNNDIFNLEIRNVLQITYSSDGMYNFRLENGTNSYVYESPVNDCVDKYWNSKPLFQTLFI